MKNLTHKNHSLICLLLFFVFVERICFLTEYVFVRNNILCLSFTNNITNIIKIHIYFQTKILKIHIFFNNIINIAFLEANLFKRTK